MIEQKITEITEKLLHIRRELHKIPETAFCEAKTSAFIRTRLTELEIPFTIVAKTGVVGLIQGAQPGKTILLRADIDGLPVSEESNVPFKSEHDGYMHACGHDVHTACLLGAAEILNGMKSELRGAVKLVFQPAEEGVGGALPMIQEGVMEQPHVDAAIAMHVEPFEQAGTIQIKDGSVMASPDDFYITIHGRGGHGAYPHSCIDPVLVGSMIVNAYQTIVSRHFDPMTPCVVSICSFHAGSCTNAIPDVAYLTGTARSLDKETRKEMELILKKIAVETAESMGASCEFRFCPLYPPTINDKKMNQYIIKAAEQLDCIENITYLEKPSMAGDDFAYFADLVPASYFKLGIGNEDTAFNHPLHHTQFHVNEKAIPIGTAVLVQSVIEYLND